jgi:hypothetical protein
MLNTTEDCRRKALTLALEFRLGKNTQAALDMAEMVNTLIAIFPTTNPASVQQLGQILGQILQCQERRDWLGLADYLEYELQELLQPGH